MPTIQDTQIPVEKTAATDFRKSIPQSRETEVWQKNNFPEMRIALEKLTGTTVTSDGPEGILYTTYGLDRNLETWEDTATKDINYNWGVGNKYMKALLADAKTQKELTKLAALTFKDIKGDEWYARHIPTAAYFGVIGGYPDGTFKGSAPVSRAEMAVMGRNAGRTFRSADQIGFAEKLTAHKNQWYYTDIEVLYGGPMGIYALTVNDVNEKITRGEVAMILARGYFDNDFIANYENLKTPLFKDIKTVSKGFIESTAVQNVQDIWKH